MKSLLMFATISLLSLASFAQRGGNQDRRLADEVSQLSDRLNMRIQRELGSMDNMKIKRVLGELNDLRQVLNDRGGHQPPPMRRHSVRGNIEQSSFDFVASSLDELNEMCMAFYSQKRLGSVDDINVSVNFGAEHKLRNNSSYWKSAGEVCGQILAIAKQEGIRLVSLDYDFIVTGSVETSSFTFKGQDRIDINQQCVDFYDRYRLGSVDDIILSVNFEMPKVKRNNSSYWKTSFEVCQQIISEL